MKKREVFAELVAGFDELKAAREGKVTLKKFTAEYKPAPKMTATQVVQLRTKLDLSQPVLARKLRTEVKTLKNWEQGRSKPNAQAAILLKLVEVRPDLLDVIASL